MCQEHPDKENIKPCADEQLQNPSFLLVSAAAINYGSALLLCIKLPNEVQDNKITE